MKASTFTQSPQAFLLTQGEPGTPVAQICRQVGISQAGNQPVNEHDQARRSGDVA